MVPHPNPSSPTAPLTLAETGLSPELVTELVLKTLHRGGELSGAELARRVALRFTIVESSLDVLKARSLCEIAGGPMVGGPAFRYRLTERGRERALSALAQNQYCGAAPVSIEQYVAYTKRFRTLTKRTVTAADVRETLSQLILSERVLDEIGPAVNGGHSIFIYGPPGNGKTVMARAIRALLPGTIAIPHALAVGDAIVRVFDPTTHEAVTETATSPDDECDPRWVECRRPMMAVGGELTLDSLLLAYNSRSGVYRAPIQILANGGVLLIDEFGRERCHPRDLLNWWMVPLESGVESLSLQSGEKIEMPFFPLIIFATNLRPSELVDEAFLRRIRHKIYAANPTPDEFIRIFARTCQGYGIPFDRTIVEQLLARVYRPLQIELRGCHPRDLISHAIGLADYRGEPRVLTFELLETACTDYFVDDRGALVSTPGQSETTSQGGVQAHLSRGTLRSNARHPVLDEM